MNLSERYFRPAKLKHRLNSDGELFIDVLDGGFGYIGQVELKIMGGLPIEDADFTININNGVITQFIPINRGKYKNLPIIQITPNQERFSFENFRFTEWRRRPLAFFSDTLNNLPDSPETPTGARVTLTTSAFDIKWDDLTFKWDDLNTLNFEPIQLEAQIDINNGELIGVNIINAGNGYLDIPTIEVSGGGWNGPHATITLSPTDFQLGILQNVPASAINNNGAIYEYAPNIAVEGGVPIGAIHNWDTLGYGNYYELEWVVTGPRQFNYKNRGRVDVLKEHEVILPFEGLYTVELKLYDTANTITNLIKQDFIEVLLPNVNFGGIYRHTDNLTTWNQLDKSWDRVGGTWWNPTYSTQKLEDFTISWDDTDVKKYYGVDISGIPQPNPIDVYDINETDIFIGRIKTMVGDNIILEMSKISPPPTMGSNIFLRLNENIIQETILEPINLLWSLGINDVNSDQVDSISGEFFKIGWNWASATIMTGFSLPEYVLQNPEFNDIYEAPSIIFEYRGEFLPNESSLANSRTIFIRQQDIGFPITWTAIELIDFIENEILILHGTDYYLRTIIKNVNGEDQYVDIEVADISTDLDLGVIVGKIQVNAGANVIYDPNGFDNIFPFAPNINSILLKRIVDDSPLQIEDFITSFNMPSLESVLKVFYTDMLFSVDNSGAWLSEAPIFLWDFGTGTHKVIGVGNEDGIEVSLKISNINNIDRIGPGWDVLRKIGNSITLKGIHDIKINDWIKIEPKPNTQPTEISIIGWELDTFNTYIECQNGLPDLKNHKIKIYKSIINNNVNILDINEYDSTITLDFGENIQYLYNTILSNGFDKIILNNNRFKVLNAILLNTETIVFNVDPIDVSLTWLSDVAQLSYTNFRYNYYNFTGKVIDVTELGGVTRLLLDFNFWTAPFDLEDKINETFNQSPVADNWFFEYNGFNNISNTKIISRGVIDGNTFLRVDDIYKTLWGVGVGNIARVLYYDEKQIEKQLGINNVTWDLIESYNISWDSLDYFTWDMFWTTHGKVPTFKITKVAQGGKIKFNEEPEFQFTKIINQSLPIIDIWKMALEDLQTSTNPGMQRFTFDLDNAITPTSIIARAKVPGSDGLGYINFSVGVEGEWEVDPTLSHSYPSFPSQSVEWIRGDYGIDNTNPWWDHTNIVYNIGIDPDGNFGWYPMENLPRVYESIKEPWLAKQIPYLPAVSGDINFNELRYFNRGYITIPLLTTVMMSETSSIKGKVSYLWTIYKNGRKIIQYNKKYFAWTFIEEGLYDITLAITDNKGNTKSITKNGIIKVVKKL